MLLGEMSGKRLSVRSPGVATLVLPVLSEAIRPLRDILVTLTAPSWFPIYAIAQTSPLLPSRIAISHLCGHKLLPVTTGRFNLSVGYSSAK